MSPFNGKRKLETKKHLRKTHSEDGELLQINVHRGTDKNASPMTIFMLLQKLFQSCFVQWDDKMFNALIILKDGLKKKITDTVKLKYI